MKTDFDLRNDLLEELLWDPLIPDARVAVTVQNGIVTFTGNLDTYTEKIALRHAAQRVVGVGSIALDVTIRPPKTHQRTDTEIAAAIEHVLCRSTSVPREKITAEVEDGWITLGGELDWNVQRQTVEQIITPLKGVIGITDNITLKPVLISRMLPLVSRNP